MAMVAVTASSAAEISITTKERTSLELRLLQTELMVAALSCSAADRYNAFVTLYRSQLTDGGKTMQNLFKRVHGAQAFSRINSFVTQMANEASLRMVRDTNRFCDDTGTMFEALLGGGKDSLDATRSRFRCAPISGFAGCAIEATATATAEIDDEQATVSSKPPAKSTAR